MEKRYHWKLQNREIVLGERTLFMGILNVTPDSFSDGGEYEDPDRAVARALELEAEGADIIDIGAESTKPGSERVPEEEELRRLLPVLKKLRGKLRVPISVDTYKSGVAEKALEHGAEIINDPSGVLLDLQLPKVVTKYDAGLIINHMHGTPETWSNLKPVKHLMRTITIDLEASIHRARQGRVEKHQMVVDPGLGFGKRREQNAEIIAQLRALKEFDLPIAIGPSRKSFLRREQTQETEFATAGAVAACILNGAHILRVHDVQHMKAVADIADMVRRAQAVEEEQAAARLERQRSQERQRQKEEFIPANRRPPLRQTERPDAEKPSRDRFDQSEDRPFVRSRDSGEEGNRPPRRRLDTDDRRPPSRFSERAEGDRPERFSERAGADRPPRGSFGREDRPSRGRFNREDRPSRGRFGREDRPPFRSQERPGAERPPRSNRFEESDKPANRFREGSEENRPPRNRFGKSDGPPTRFRGKSNTDRPPRKFSGPPRDRSNRPGKGPRGGRPDRRS